MSRRTERPRERDDERRLILLSIMGARERIHDPAESGCHRSAARSYAVYLHGKLTELG